MKPRLSCTRARVLADGAGKMNVIASDEKNTAQVVLPGR